MGELAARHLFDLSLNLHDVIDLGGTPAGNRRLVPVAGGRFEGDRLSGEVLPVCGSDLLLERNDGSFQQDVRLALRSDQGDHILMTYRGIRHSSAEVAAALARGEQVQVSSYYLRIVPFFETASPDLSWLNKIVTIGLGERRPTDVSYRVLEVL